MDWNIFGQVPVSQAEHNSALMEQQRYSNAVHQSWIHDELKAIKRRLDALEHLKDDNHE